jgi:hypothetical protein
MRHLFVATLMVFGALLIVLGVATGLQNWQIAHAAHSNGPAFDEAVLAGCALIEEADGQVSRTAHVPWSLQGRLA